MGKAGKKSSGKKLRATRGRAITPQNAVSTVDQIRNLEAAVGRSRQDIPSALALAERYLVSGQEPRVIEVLAPLSRQYPFDNPVSAATFDLLLAFGYAHSNRLAEADQVIQRALTNSNDPLDLYYVQSYVKLSLREYDGAIAAAQMYLRLRDKRAQGQTSLASSSAHLAQLYNFLGGAYREKNELDNAIESFKKALAADAGNHLPYLNLANLHVQMNDQKAAAEIVKCGLKACRQIQELRMLEEAIRNRSTVSACMIVKNEEEQLGRCLESIRDWVDEIIVVDTGSTDRTVEIAQSYGARIYHQAWEGDFSKHRNYSLEQASSDWCFVVDADEEFCRDGLEHLRELLNQPKCQVISINVYNVYPNECTTTFLPSIRFFRNGLKLRYEGIVHNNLQISPDLPVYRARVRLNHYGYDLSPEKMRAKAARTKALLEKQLAENPDKAFALFNYAQVLRGEGDESREVNAPIILRMAQKAVNLTDPENPAERAIHLMCLDQLAWTYFYLKENGQAVECAQRAISIKSNYLDPILLLGHIYARQREFDKAIAWYDRYLDAQAKYVDTTESDNIILIHIDSRATAYYSLAAINELLGRSAQARHYYRLTLSINPHHLEANLGLGRHLLSEGNLVDAEACFAAQLAQTPGSIEALLGLGYIAYQRRDLDSSMGYYQSVVELDSDNSTALLKLGQICMQSNRESEGVRYFQMALDAGSSDQTVEQQLAEFYFNSARYAEAVERYDHLLSRTQPTSGLLNDLGNCYFRMNRLDTAEQYYLKAISVIPVNNLAFRNLGVTLARMGRMEESLEALNKYLTTADAQFQVHKVAGDVCMRAGRIGEAIGHFEEYLAKSPSDFEALYSLSECYLTLGHTDSAVLGYQRVLQLSPDFGPAREKLDQLLDLEIKVQA